MKKVFWSTAAAALFILSMSGCANTAAPIQTENRPPQATVESMPEPTEATEDTQAVLSAGNTLLAEDSAAEDVAKLELPAEPSSTPMPQTTPAPTATLAPQATPVTAPQETPTSQATPAPAKITIQFTTITQKEAEESPAPTHSADPGPESTPVTPASEPSVEPAPPTTSQTLEPAFSIDHWLAYAKDYAKGAGLNLDPTATACWDNPITAGAHCAYLERDIQSRLNRYARDESISDVWIWAEQRTDGSYDFYIGYA